MTMTMLESWESSANNLIAHFAVIGQGHIPFTLDWLNLETGQALGVDLLSKLYMVEMTRLLQERGKHLLSTLDYLRS